MTSSAVEHAWTLDVDRPTSQVARVELAGVWRNENRLPDPDEIWSKIRTGSGGDPLTFDTSRVTDWDSGLVTFAIKVLQEARARGFAGAPAALPEGAQRVLPRAEAVPDRQTGRSQPQPAWLARVGGRATAAWAASEAGL